MEQNSKHPTILDSELLNEISKTNCGIKYPENIISCLKSMNFYDHLEICPHYCPVGKIIKICSTTTGISSIWVAVSSQILPINGEALYILKRNSEILKNDFPLIGFRGKNFTRLNIPMLKIDDLCIHRIVHQLEIGVKIYFKHWEKCSLHLVEIPREGIKITIREPMKQIHYSTTLKPLSGSSTTKFAGSPTKTMETNGKDFSGESSSAVVVSLSSSVAAAGAVTTKAGSLFTSSVVAVSLSSSLAAAGVATTTTTVTTKAGLLFTSSASLSSSAAAASKIVVTESLPSVKEAETTKDVALSTKATTEAAEVLASLSSKAAVTASLETIKETIGTETVEVLESLSSKAAVTTSLATIEETVATKETEAAEVLASLLSKAVATSLSSSEEVVAVPLLSSKTVATSSLSSSEEVVAVPLSSSEAVVAESLLSSEAFVAESLSTSAATDATTLATPNFEISSSSSESSIYCTHGSTSEESTTEESYENFGFINEESFSDEGLEKTLHNHYPNNPNILSETIDELDTNNHSKIPFATNQKSFFSIPKTESNSPQLSSQQFDKTNNSCSKLKIVSQKEEIIAKVETYLDSQVPIVYHKSYPLLESVCIMEKSERDLDSLVCSSYNANIKPGPMSTFNDQVPSYENCFPIENLTMTKFHLMNANFMRRSELKFPQWPTNDLTNYSSGSSMSNVEFFFSANTTPSYENIKERPQAYSDEFLTKIFTFLFRQFDFVIVILLCLLLLFIFYILIHYKGDQ